MKFRRFYRMEMVEKSKDLNKILILLVPSQTQDLL